MKWLLSLFAVLPLSIVIAQTQGAGQSRGAVSVPNYCYKDHLSPQEDKPCTLASLRSAEAAVSQFEKRCPGRSPGNDFVKSEMAKALSAANRNYQLGQADELVNDDFHRQRALQWYNAARNWAMSLPKHFAPWEDRCPP